MDEHIHTGFIVFVTVGVYATLFQWLMKLIAAHLAMYPPTERVGTALGGIFHSA